jgi:hypothetical protein
MLRRGEVRQELSREEEELLREAVYMKYCVCFSSSKKGIIIRSVKHDLKKNILPADTSEIRYLVLVARIRFS